MNNDIRLNPSNFKLKTSVRDQYEFHTFCLDQLVPDEHKVRTVWDFILNMDLSACLDELWTFQGASGRAAIDPKILFCLWIYSIIDGNASARKLEELCLNHTIYKWICGGVSVNRTTLAEFRSHNPRKFDELLTSCLAVMVKSGVLSDTDFSQDGTRVKANASNNSFRREASLKELEDDLIKYIETLKKEEKSSPNAYEKKITARKERFAIEKKERVQAALRSLNEARCLKINSGKKVTDKDLEEMRASTTDPEVRRMKMGDSGFRLAYNVQFATGLDSRVIFGVDVLSVLDPGAAPRLMTQVQERLKNLKLSKIKNWIADSAYSAKNELMTVAQLFPDCFYFAPPQMTKNVKIHKKNDSDVVKKWRDNIDSEPVKELYKKRCSTAEFSNMHVKNQSLKEITVRGRVKAKGMALLHAIAQNVVRFMDLIKDKI
jgi:transposase